MLWLRVIWPPVEHTKRIKLVYVTQHLALWIFASSPHRWRDGEFIRVVDMKGLPETARVLSVNFTPDRASFVFTVEDESFDEVPLGAQIPELRVKVEYVEIAVKDRPVLPAPAA